MILERKPRADRPPVITRLFGGNISKKAGNRNRNAPQQSGKNR